MNKPDSERLRNRTCHGWAFRVLEPAEETAVRAYLASGNPSDLDGTSYRAMRDDVYETMPARQRH
ncbi:hypothetical protein SEA_STEAMY_90 [Mycobacterium phage Steamy]|uniref:Uncharacterized protein n=1 Tax=Mycobacterium phage Steamy TaxID=2250309 RepID=A0A345L0R2_9CAUD|nr:hypothetical protein KIV62_gp11 [Mycobacterium phage Steamy]AXH48864.1 hypothetical protein SEA_STEAMY_90 [Mycobacterium phage Steamy]